MKQFRTALMTAAVLFGAAAASGASAASIVVTSVGTGNGNDGATNATIGGTTYWTTPILLTFAPPPTITAYQQTGVAQTPTSQTWVVFCDDLFHEIGVGGGTNYAFTLGQVTGYYTAANIFTSIAAVTSNQMGQLANIGRYDFNHGDEAGAIAAQTGIWALEYGAYGTTAANIVADPNAYFSSSLSTTVVSELSGLKVGAQYAEGLIPTNGYAQQAQILGSVPEPSTWAMMLVGIGGLGLTLRGARRKSKMAVAAA